MRLFKYDLLIINIRLNRLDARQRLAILNAKCNLCNKDVIVFSLPIVSMWSDKDAGRPMHPRTYMMSHITSSIRYISKFSGRRVCIYLSKAKLVEQLTNKMVKVKDVVLKIRPLMEKAKSGNIQCKPANP